MGQQTLTVGVPGLDRRCRRRPVGDDDLPCGLVDPPEGGHVDHRAVEDAALAHAGLRRPPGLPPDQLVAPLAQPTTQVRNVARAHGTLEHRPGHAVDLHEHDARDVRLLGSPAGAAGHRLVEPGIVVEGQRGGDHRRDGGQPDDDDQARPEPVEGDAGQQLQHHRHEDRVEDDGPDPEGQHRQGHDDEGECRPDDRVHDADDETGEQGVRRAVDVEVVEQPGHEPQRQRRHDRDDEDPPQDPRPRRPVGCGAQQPRRFRWDRLLGHGDSGGWFVGGRAMSDGPPGCREDERATGFHGDEPLSTSRGGELLVESTQRVTQPARSAPTQAHRAVGPPVDRHHQARLHELGRPHRPRRVEVAFADGRPPPSDREQGEIDVLQLDHLREEVGVPREVHRPLGGPQHVAHGVDRDSAVRAPLAAVDSRNGLDGEALDLRRGAGGCLADLPEAAAPQERCRTPRHDHEDVATEQLQGGDVEVIHVHVRDQHDIGDPERRRVDAMVPAEVGQPLGEGRVGHDPDAPHLDDHAGVAEPRDHRCRHLREATSRSPPGPSSNPADPKASPVPCSASGPTAGRRAARALSERPRNERTPGRWPGVSWCRRGHRPSSPHSPAPGHPGPRTVRVSTRFDWPSDLRP